jgi:Na+/proline symporter
VSLSGLAVAVLLISSLLLAHFSIRAQPMRRSKPLDVDEGLPLPEVSQASTVFSLTALFGAYFGIFVVLGLPALAGLACGTVFSLFTIRYWIRELDPESFEHFLMRVFNRGSRNGIVLAILLSLIQCSFAASELLILREISRVLLGLQPHHATLVAVAIGLIGYFYVLFGGYVAVFRTDVLQFVFVAAMALAFSTYAIATGHSLLLEKLLPRAGYWEFPISALNITVITYVYQFLIGLLMGFAFLAAAPDTWKRVFIVTKLRSKTLPRFSLFVVVGMLPFILLAPVVLSMPPIPDGVLDTNQIYLAVPVNRCLFVVAALGLTCTFLSSFNSAIIISAHVGLILNRTQKQVRTESDWYNWLLVSVLLTCFFIFEAFLSVGNPYLLGNLLLGPYTLAAGIQAGSWAKPDRLPEGSVLWLVIGTMCCWTIYVGYTIEAPRVATTYQFNTVPVGVAILPVVFAMCSACLYVSRKLKLT